jgi:RHS repeat-associated protein
MVICRRYVAFIVVLVALASHAMTASAAFPGADGRILAQGETAEGNGLLSENTDGTDRHLLVAYPFYPSYGSRTGGRAQLSPDGKTVAFVADFQSESEERAEDENEREHGVPVEGEGAGIYTIPSHGGKATRITLKRRLSGCVSEVAWSPGGSQFVYTRTPWALGEGLCNPTSEAPSGEFSKEIVVGNGSGADKRVGWGLDPVWSSNGKIAYLTASGIAITTPSGGGSTTLETGTDESIDWSPDGTKLVFTTENTISSGYFNPELNSSELWTINADGSGITRIGTGSQTAVWAPDGRSLVSTLVSVMAGPKLVYFRPSETEGCRVSASATAGTAALSWGVGEGEELEHNHGACKSEPEKEEQYGEASAGEPGRGHCSAGKPVNCATGNESTTQTDLSVGGRGPRLDLSRTYNDQLARSEGEMSGSFGTGWTSSFSAHLVFGPQPGLVTVHQDNGSIVRYEQTSEEAFQPLAPLVQAILVKESGSYTYTLPDQTRLHFNGAGELTSETDRNGNALTIHRGIYDRVESISDAAGRAITFSYGEGGAEAHVEAATDPIGNRVEYTYEHGNLVSVVEPGESTSRWKFKYGSMHELTSVTDGRGHTTTTEYDEAGRAVKQTDAMGRTRKWEYGSTETGSQTTILEPNGALTVDYFDKEGLPTQVTRAFGTSVAATTKYEYDGSEQLMSMMDPDGHTSKYTYDAAGDRTSVEDPNKDETKWTYDTTHDVETTTTPNGETTTIKRDAHGNAESVSRPAPGAATQTTKYKYDSHGDLEGVEDPLKHVWKYEYNVNGDRTAEIDPEGAKRSWAYNEDSQETSTVSPRGHVTGAKESSFTTSIERDARGRAVKVTDPLKHITKYAYDADGNLESQSDPEGNITSYTYDFDDEPTKVKEPNGATSETEHDSEGRVVAQIDGLKHTTKYVRNLLGEVSEVIDPLARKALKEYDAAGNLTRLTDAAKRTTKYSYDPANRLSEVDYSSEATPDVKYEYDADGNRTKMVDGMGTSKYSYDQLDRLTEARDGHGDVVGYEYDIAGEQTKITYPSGKSVSRAFDKAGRLESVTDWLGHTSKFAYDADSDQTSTTFPTSTGDVDQYAYAASDAMESVTMKKGAETLASLEYTRNKDGQVTKATTKGLPGEEKPAFSYDENSRLTKGAGIKYAYDAANNLTGIASSTLTYDAASQLEKGGSITYAYDELGQRTAAASLAIGSFSYGYDQAGDLTSVSRSKFGELPAIADSYGYDGDGMRASQTISGSTAYMSWDAAEALPLLLGDGTSSFIYGPSGLPIEQVSGETVQYLHHDQQGSTRMLTGSSGTAVATTTFDAYGNKLGSTGSATTALGYDGQYTSADTGLIYLRARVYDPTTAQFMSGDPAVALTWQAYGYAFNDPLDWGDWKGLGAVALPLEGSDAAACLTPETIGPCAVVGVGGYLAVEAAGSIVTAWAGEEAGNDEGHAFLEQRQAEEAAEERAGDCPSAPSQSLPYRGEPNSTGVLDRGNGSGQIRDYGPDGLPLRDFDFGHDHGFGDPHVHDWPGGVRGNGRPLQPGE